MKRFAIALAAILLPSIGLAKDGSDGCGLGWRVNGSNSFIGTTTRSTTNMTSPFRPFAMTSGTSGCAKHPFVKKQEEEAALYAETNYDALLLDMSVGRGEYLQGLARTFGCHDAAYGQFQSEVRQNFKTIVNQAQGEDSGVHLFLEVKKQILRNPALASMCSVTA